jgi:hypothetical protein
LYGARDARALFERGVESVQREAWEEAEGFFERSAGLVPRQSTLYNLALCRYRLERHVEALQTIDRLLSSTEPPEPGTRAHAEKLRERSLGRVVVLDVTVEPIEATIVVDGATLPRASTAVRTLYLPPGSHDVSVSSPGRVPVRLSVQGKPGQAFARSIALAVLPAAEPATEPSAPRSPAAATPASTGVSAHWILLGAGSLLLASAAVTGAIAWKADSDFVEACPTLRECDPGDRALRDRARTFATTSDVLLGLGLATGGVGAVLLLRAESSGSRVGAIGVQLRGSL